MSKAGSRRGSLFKKGKGNHKLMGSGYKVSAKSGFRRVPHGRSSPDNTIPGSDKVKGEGSFTPISKLDFNINLIKSPDAEKRVRKGKKKNNSTIPKSKKEIQTPKLSNRINIDKLGNNNLLGSPLKI